MNMQEIVSELQRVAPPWLAEDGDNVGLQLGSIQTDVNAIAVAWQPTRQNMMICAKAPIDLLVVHRPLFREPMSRLVADDVWGKAVIELIKARKSLYVLGDSLDLTDYGPTDVLCDVLDLPEDRLVLVPVSAPARFKVVVFTPPEAVDAVRDAMANVGAGTGFAGHYSHCSFAAKGTGTFMPLEGAQPYSGEGIGKLAKESEYRLEMLVSERYLYQVVFAMIQTHPYEQVAYDIYPLINIAESNGMGRIMELDEEIDLDSLASEVFSILDDESMRVYGSEEHEIKRVAVYAGDGSDLIKPAHDMGADMLIAGDLTTEAVEEAEALDLNLIDVRMDMLMKPGMRTLSEHLSATFGENGVNVAYLDDIPAH